MRIVVPCEIEEVKRRIRYRVRLESGPVEFCVPLALNAEIRGNVKENAFWLQRTGPHFVNIPQRYFCGTLEQEDDHTVIEGKFKHTRLTTGSALVLFAWVIFCSFGARSPLPLLMMVLLFPLLGLSSIWYEREETAVIDFLNRLNRP